MSQPRAALTAPGCIRIYEEKASGAKRDLPELLRVLDSAHSAEDPYGSFIRNVSAYAEALDGTKAQIEGDNLRSMSPPRRQP